MTPLNPADVVLAESFAGEMESQSDLTSANAGQAAMAARPDHTPAPWRINTAGHGESSGLYVLDEIYVYAPNCGVDDVAVAADIADPLTGKPSEANAARIVACVNAMEGLSNDQVASLRESRDALVKALERISHAKPDRLDHSIDVSIIERCANVARAALAAAKEQA